MVPPVALAEADPSDPPKQLTLLSSAVAATSTAGCVIVALAVVVHPLASVTVTVYVPGPRFVAVATDAPVDHAYEYAGVPPDPAPVAVPSLAPVQLTLVTVVEAVSKVGSDIRTVSVSVHPFASVTVTVNVPAVNPVAVAVVAPVFQE